MTCDVTKFSKISDLGTVAQLDVADGIVLLTDEDLSLYIGNKFEEEASVASFTELFGVGSGAWALGKDAEDRLFETLTHRLCEMACL
jgi:hypothetical protein